MSEWWTYRLSDFLMFSPKTYWRLLELYNRQFWPAQMLLTLVGLLALVLAKSQKSSAGPALVMLLAMAWLGVGWAFHWQRYAAINWAAQYLAAACVVQALLLLGLGMAAMRCQQGAVFATPISGWRRKLGWTLSTAALAYPLAAVATGQGWTHAEVWGLMPEPTALFSLGLLKLSPYFDTSTRFQQALLTVIPVLSLVIGGATRWAIAG